jgi:hypothetical protein
MATKAEILAIITTQEGYSTPPDGVLTYALNVYSKRCPRLVKEVVSDAYGLTEIELADDSFGTVAKCTMISGDYEYTLNNYEFLSSLNKVKFYAPIPYEEINIYYYIGHTLTDTECTIPNKHVEAFAYLVCHFMSLRSISSYYAPDSIEAVDNGIIKVKYNTSKSSKQGLRTYYERYLEIVASSSPAMGYINPAEPVLITTVDALNYPYTSEW